MARPNTCFQPSIITQLRGKFQECFLIVQPHELCGHFSATRRAGAFCASRPINRPAHSTQETILTHRPPSAAAYETRFLQQRQKIPAYTNTYKPTQPATALSQQPPQTHQT